MRLHTFATTQFSGLEHEAAQVPWELYLSPGTLGKIQVATHHCRLHHTDGIAERVRSAAEKRLGTASIAGGEAAHLQQVYVRGVDDRFTISLDSSGDRLHLRGIKTHPGRAPLRETLAAAALIQAGFTVDEPLTDPMCGTGTFALEAALLAKRIPPGWFRHFAFEAWPAFRPQRWAYLRRTAGERIATLGRPGIFASDIDSDACRALGDCIEEHRLTDAVQVQTTDFFGLDPTDLPVPGPGLVVINPPYGRRLGTPSEGRRLVQSILARLHERFAGWRFVLVAPASVRPAGLPPGTAVHAVSHGGLNVQFWIGRMP
jgi:putative N6-adenine-specific DNA methylase